MPNGPVTTSYHLQDCCCVTLTGTDITFGRTHTDHHVNRSYKMQVLQDPAITGNSKNL